MAKNELGCKKNAGQFKTISTTFLRIKQKIFGFYLFDIFLFNTPLENSGKPSPSPRRGGADVVTAKNRNQFHLIGLPFPDQVKDKLRGNGLNQFLQNI